MFLHSTLFCFFVVIGSDVNLIAAIVTQYSNYYIDINNYKCCNINIDFPPMTNFPLMRSIVSYFRLTVICLIGSISLGISSYFDFPSAVLMPSAYADCAGAGG